MSAGGDGPGNGSWPDPDLEARLVAQIVGEASAFEVATLERLIDRHPEIAVFKRRLEVMHWLLGEAVKPSDDAEWKLSDERRARVMQALGIGVDSEEDAAVEPLDPGVRRETRIRRASRTVLWAAAACLAVNVILIPLLFTRLGGRSWKSAESQPITTYSAAAEEPSSARPGGGDEMMDRMVSPQRPVVPQTLPVAPRRISPAGESARSGGRSYGVASSEPAKRNEKAGRAELAKSKVSGGPGRAGAPIAKGRSSKESGAPVNRPTDRIAEDDPFAAEETAEDGPASRSAAVIASSVTGGVAIPVPEVATPDPFSDFGSGDDFGSGWGGAGGGGFGGGGFGEGGGGPEMPTGAMRAPGGPHPGNRQLPTAGEGKRIPAALDDLATNLSIDSSDSLDGALFR